MRHANFNMFELLFVDVSSVAGGFGLQGLQSPALQDINAYYIRAPMAKFMASGALSRPTSSVVRAPLLLNTTGAALPFAREMTVALSLAKNAKLLPLPAVTAVLGSQVSSQISGGMMSFACFPSAHVYVSSCTLQF